MYIVGEGLVDKEDDIEYFFRKSRLCSETQYREYYI